jgi:LysM repeat protein
VEVENNGTGERWSKELLDTLDLVFAIMLLGMRRRSKWLIGHKEWTTRKIDPADGRGGLDMEKRRAQVTKQMRVLARAKQQPSPRPKEASPTGTHVVERGDTLFEIAVRHRMSVAELKKINGLESNQIHVGDKLTVRGDV